MARWAIGDVQGCYAELKELLACIRYSADRDQLWFTGDLVNRGPQSLEALRLVRALGDNALTVLGNHDLHLLAIALAAQKQRKGDTLGDVLSAPDRAALLDWLLQRPLALYDSTHNDLLVHAGVLPQWTVIQTLLLAQEVQTALRRDAPALLTKMYGDEPDQWRESLHGADRWRFAINVLSRLRFCTADGRVDLKQKGAPADAQRPWMPWFKAPARASADARVVFGHWSALGFYRGEGVVALDTGCVWGGALTALNLDDAQAEPVSVAAHGPRRRE